MLDLKDMNVRVHCNTNHPLDPIGPGAAIPAEGKALGFYTLRPLDMASFAYYLVQWDDLRIAPVMVDDVDVWLKSD